MIGKEGKNDNNEMVDDYVRAFRIGRKLGHKGGTCSTAGYARLCPFSIIKLLNV